MTHICYSIPLPYRLLSDSDYKFIKRKLLIKGKGKMTTYFLEPAGSTLPLQDPRPAQQTAQHQPWSHPSQPPPANPLSHTSEYPSPPSQIPPHRPSSRPLSPPSSQNPSPRLSQNPSPRPSPSESEVVCEDGTCVLQPRNLRPSFFPSATASAVLPSSRIGVASPAEEPQEEPMEVLFTKRLKHVTIVEATQDTSPQKPRRENTYLDFPVPAPQKKGRGMLTSEFFITDTENRNTYRASVTEVSVWDPFAAIRPRLPALPRHLCAIL